MLRNKYKFLNGETYSGAIAVSDSPAIATWEVGLVRETIPCPPTEGNSAGPAATSNNYPPQPLC